LPLPLGSSVIQIFQGALPDQNSVAGSSPFRISRKDHDRFSSDRVQVLKLGPAPIKRDFGVVQIELVEGHSSGSMGRLERTIA
jgi:hypothetical protein